MLLLEQTCESPEENLALDEALLEQAESGGQPLELLRLWEPSAPMVVLGRSGRVDVEVNREACHRHQIPILRRTSGGGTVVAGPGCLMYALVLSYELRPALRAIDLAHRLVMETNREAIASLVPDVRFDGTCDLSLAGRKFSGNSVRCRREHLLYHGTLLYSFPLELISECLRHPPREPEYRSGRNHCDFVTNLPTDVTALRAALRRVWQADEPLTDWPRERVQALVAEKYAQHEWNLKY